MNRLEGSDVVALLGAALVVLALWLLLDWPGVLLWAGIVLIVVGVAEARRQR